MWLSHTDWMLLKLKNKGRDDVEDTGIKIYGRLCDSCGRTHTLQTGVTQFRDYGNWSVDDEMGYWYFCDECAPTAGDEETE